MTWIKNNLEGLTGLVTAIVAVLGIFISYMTIRLTKRENKLKSEESRSERFSRAIAHLKDESVAIRLGALFDLKELYEGSEVDSKKLATILTSFVREHIENEQFILPPFLGRHRRRVDQDVYLAADILSTLYDKYGIVYNLSHLQANGISLWGINLRGANLIQADLMDAGFREADLRNVDLWDAYLQKANLQDVDLRGAKHLHALQLVYSIINDTTLLDPDLRAEYEKKIQEA